MSGTLNVKEILSADSRLVVGSEKFVDIKLGGANASIQPITNSSFSNQQITFTPSLNGPNVTCIDSYMYVQVPIQVTINATGAPAPLPTYLQDNFSLRQYPLASVMSTVNLQINGDASSSNPNQFIHQLSQFQGFLSGKGQAIGQSITPIMPDQSQQYSDLAGSSKSPILSYASGGEHYSSPRGEFNALFTTVTGTTGQWIFTTTIQEPIFHPLLDYTPRKDRVGFPYVRNFNLGLQFCANLSRMFSLDATTCPAVTDITVQIMGGTLIQQWITKPPTMQWPDVVLRSFESLMCNPSAVSVPFSPGEQRTINSQTFTVNQLFDKVYIAVCDSQLDVASGYTKTDTNFSIENVTISFNNKQGLMSNFTTADLYNACQSEEGTVFSYVQTRKFVGSCLAIDPSKLFGLAVDQSPGVPGPFLFQVTLQCTNLSSRTITPTLWVIWSNDTIFTTTSNCDSRRIDSFLTKENVLYASTLDPRPTNFAETDIYGGAFWDSVKNFFGKIGSFIKDNKIISKALPYLSVVAPEFAPAIGLAAKGADALGVAQTSRREMKSVARPKSKVGRY